jgi:hypothetical protein
MNTCSMGWSKAITTWRAGAFRWRGPLIAVSIRCRESKASLRVTVPTDESSLLRVPIVLVWWGG